jgi:Tol biopolymer transport system component
MIGVREAPYLWAALIGAAIGVTMALLPIANAWVPVWAAALETAQSEPPAAELYRMAADGSGQTRLTVTSADERSPAVSPDGTRVAVKIWPAEADAAQTLAVIDLRSGDRLDLVTEGFINQPSWSPDGERVLFGWQRDGAPDLQLWWVSADGLHSPERLIDEEQNSFAGQWSPDGRLLLFASGREGFGIFVANADGTDIRKVVDSPRYADAAWSPDSRLIAFTADHEGGFGLSVVASDGSGMRLIHHVDAPTLIPDWSPDGRNLVYESHQNLDGEIYAISVDGTNERNLTRNPGAEDGQGGPTVTRDGQIIYAATGYESATFNRVIRERLGMAALIIQSVLLAGGAALLFMRGWAPFGALTLMVAVASAVALGWWGVWPFMPAAIAAGFGADVVWWAFRRHLSSRMARAATGGVLTGAYAAGYLTTVGSTLFVTWPADWWPGGPGETAGIGYSAQVILLTVALTAGIGLLFGFVSAGSHASAPARSEPG